MNFLVFFFLSGLYLIYDYSICPSALQAVFSFSPAKKFCPFFRFIGVFHPPEKYFPFSPIIFQKPIDRTRALL